MTLGGRIASVTSWKGMQHDMDYYRIHLEWLHFGIGSEGVQPLANFTSMSYGYWLIVIDVQVVMSI